MFAASVILQLIILGESPYYENTVSSQWVHLLSMLRLLRLLRLLSVSKVRFTVLHELHATSVLQHACWKVRWAACS